MAARLLVFCLAIAGAHALEQSQREATLANPIRKVVTMLQDMQKKVTAEGEKEQELYDAFMCYCKSGAGDLQNGIDVGNAKIDALTTSIKESKEKKAQTEASLKANQGSRADAKSAIAEATALREKQAATYASESSDYKTNIAALGKAISAVDGGMAGSFLQTTYANVVKRFALEKADMADTSRQELLAFLSGQQQEGYTPASGEISGILKQLKDDMSKSLAEITTIENDAIASYEALMAAKNKEVAALSAQIEQQLLRVGELGVSIAGMGTT